MPLRDKLNYPKHEFADTMKPIKANVSDTEALVDLGRASVQIIHDLKNQVNGLKLYATFLHKRMEKSERPIDELETIGKIMAGLERAAADMNTLVRFGRPLELQRQRLDLAPLLTKAVEGGLINAQAGSYVGDFDAATLAEAFKNLHVGARSLMMPEGGERSVSLRREETAGMPIALIEWRGIRDTGDADLFGSFNGATGLRLALAAKVIKAHEGTVEQEPNALRVRLPLRRDEG